MKIITLLGLFLDLLGVVILGIGEVTRGAAYLRHLRESYKDSFDYDVQQRTWPARLLLVLGAKLGAAMSGGRREPTPYRAFPLTVCGFFLLISNSRS